MEDIKFIHLVITDLKENTQKVTNYMMQKVKAIQFIHLIVMNIWLKINNCKLINMEAYCICLPKILHLEENNILHNAKGHCQQVWRKTSVEYLDLVKLLSLGHHSKHISLRHYLLQMFIYHLKKNQTKTIKYSLFSLWFFFHLFFIILKERRRGVTMDNKNNSKIPYILKHAW